MSDQATAGGGGAHYGGFWIRVLAYIVDGIILNIAIWIIGAIFGVSMFSMDMSDPAAMEAMGTGIAIMQVAIIIVWLAYTVGFTSSSLQATPGKLLVKLKVTDNDGQRLSVLRALGRELSKIISSIILMIGFINAIHRLRSR